MVDGPVKLLARDMVFEVNRGDEGSPDWTEIKGISSLTYSPTTNRANTTTFDTQGFLSHIVASRGVGFTLAGLRLEDPLTGERDPGQAFVEASALRFTYEAFEDYRITGPGGEVYEFEASVEVTPFGGGNDDPNTWSGTFTVNEAPVIIPTGS